MAFKIDVKAGKPIKPPNMNSHDIAAWGSPMNWQRRPPLISGHVNTWYIISTNTLTGRGSQIRTVWPI